MSHHKKQGFDVPQITGIKRLYVKYFNPVLYKRLKVARGEFMHRPTVARHRAMFAPPALEKIFVEKTKEVVHPSMDHRFKPLTTFLHSGNSGDIIYSLPVAFALAKKGKVIFYLQIDQKAAYIGFHPLGNVMLNRKMAEMLIPLLNYQPDIESCSIYEGEEVDYDLDLFRRYTLHLDRGSISRWYFHVFGIGGTLYKPWLIAPKDESLKDTIVIARSHRYRSPVIDYSFLKQYDKLLFIGVQEEYEDMKTMIPNLEWKKMNDFLEMATVINSCRLFIGNQSFPFSIAEGLKVNRLLEVYFITPNVIPEGPGANDFVYQPQFEASVKRLYENPEI